jgi:hypothetical protein
MPLKHTQSLMKSGDVDFDATNSIVREHHSGLEDTVGPVPRRGRDNLQDRGSELTAETRRFRLGCWPRMTSLWEVPTLPLQSVEGADNPSGQPHHASPPIRSPGRFVILPWPLHAGIW